MKKTAYLYVERDDHEYDYKAGFASYAEANDYRQECQRSWMSHCDYVYLWTGSERIAPMKKQIIRLIGSVKTNIAFGLQ